MSDRGLKKRVFGWMMFDWASQPYNTLLLTFIFGPYFASAVVDDPVKAQSLWGFAIGFSGMVIAILSPILGAIADTSGRKMPWIWIFSALYVLGSAALWLAVPGSEQVVLILVLFCLGLIGMEFATTFTNAMLPTLGDRDAIGRISGTGWAVGYAGGVTALVIMLLFFAENDAGVTLLGSAPILGLDPETREGTRSVGPFSALWYVVFMIPFFLFIREPLPDAPRDKTPVRKAVTGLWQTIRTLPQHKSFASFLLASMFYRDGLSGMFTFGGIFAAGVLGWTVVDIGIFGILAATTGAIFAWIGGRADSAYGPKPVIVVCIIALLIVSACILGTSREAIFGVPVGPDSALPDIFFYVLGAAIGACAGAVQSASRTMLVRQGDGERMTEAFGLYALAGKATAFLAPTLIGVVTLMSESQRIGVAPVVGLFVLGLVLMLWVKPDGEKT